MLYTALDYFEACQRLPNVHNKSLCILTTHWGVCSFPQCFVFFDTQSFSSNFPLIFLFFIAHFTSSLLEIPLSTRVATEQNYLVSTLPPIMCVIIWHTITHCLWCLVYLFLFQSKMIQTFMTQIADLQTEIKCLAKTQLDMSVVIQKQDSELKREKKHKDQLKKKYKVRPLTMACYLMIIVYCFICRHKYL